MNDTAAPETLTDPGDALACMRAAAPLVQCITNDVAMDLAANVLLAAGASPAMVHNRAEAAQFAKIATALTINTGTPTPESVLAMEEAATAARAAGRPWAFDPVAIGASDYRRALCARLAALGPSVVRGNPSEILTLAGAGGSARGPDSADGVAAAETAARALAAELGTVVAVTGPEDFVTDGVRTVRVAGGDPLMTKITAVGCALTALLGAYLGARLRPFDAAIGALAAFGAAGARAGATAQGPGSFRVAFLDGLAGLTPEQLKRSDLVRPA